MASLLGKLLVGGAAAGYTINSAISNQTSNLPANPTRRRRLGYEDMASGGFWRKQGTLFGMAAASGDWGGYFGHGLNTAVGTVSGPVGGSAAIGGAFVGVAGSFAFSKLTKGTVSFGQKSAWAGRAIALTSGAVMGGITARKIQLQLSEQFNTVRKNLYKKPMFSNKARTQGPGYRLWAQRTAMGKPGHLGVTGSLPFAMHSARHRSTV